jgi:hypothetical protein
VLSSLGNLQAWVRDETSVFFWAVPCVFLSDLSTCIDSAYHKESIPQLSSILGAKIGVPLSYYVCVA